MGKWKLIKFVDDGNSFDINFDERKSTVWMSLNEIAKFYEKDKSVISRHIKNIFNEGTLQRDRTVTKSATVAPNGRTYNVDYYKLDLIILVGRKIGSNRGLNLKDFLDGKTAPSINEKQEFPNDIIIYDNGKVNVSLKYNKKEQTIWATQSEIAELFDTTQPNVSAHIKNILNDKELNENSIYKNSLYISNSCQDSFDVESVGEDSSHTSNSTRLYLTTFYSLDMILAVGYRVKTSKAIAFRNWVTSVLKEYILEGYSINESRILRNQENLVELISKTNALLMQLSKGITYYPGEELRGFIEIKRFLETAKHEILIVDNYFGHEFDEVLSTLKVKKTVITDPQNHKIDSCENYKVIKTKISHDRYILVDDVCYHFGASVKDLGDSLSTGHLFTDQNVIEIFKLYTKENKREVK